MLDVLCRICFSWQAASTPAVGDKTTDLQDEDDDEDDDEEPVTTEAEDQGQEKESILWTS